ncbi:hypothetical protein MUK42_34880 [Musa troglodytarum]|uniref:Uncharacterized protein n=1 Tax=Musa troglodytarum TaxID=320322 RepID=A0A9E7JTL4_9LILI|nr:hypothetical protein MUK42_34880 [Musa troglodytarum]
MNTLLPGKERGGRTGTATQGVVVVVVLPNLSALLQAFRFRDTAESITRLPNRDLFPPTWAYVTL